MATPKFTPENHDDEGETSASAPTATKVVVHGDKLHAMITMLKPFLSTVKDPFLSFGPEGVMLHASVEAQRVFVPLSTAKFSEYIWNGPAAMFLALVDGRKTLLDAFRPDKKKEVMRVEFNFHGTYPTRDMAQTITYKNVSDGHVWDMTNVKYELVSYNCFWPSQNADTTVALSKSQFQRVIGLSMKTQPEELVFCLKPEGGLCIGTMYGIIQFDITPVDMDDYPFSRPTSSTKTLIGKVTKRARSDCLYGIGSGKPFCMALGDIKAFNSVMQKVKSISSGFTLAFYTSTQTPMLRVCLDEPSRTSFFFFCTYECLSIEEIEEVCAIDGTMKLNKITDLPVQRKRKDTGLQHNCLNAKRMKPYL
ncbi:UL42 [anatid alphaherpesvirus 1]|nr:UL42 [Anatid alphaherpesvirus 1]WKE35599.1 UL42 [Anatid alphaherpesvirus 1]WOC94976.1 UL42 [Anatid alphaherpesvirus 1]